MFSALPFVIGCVLHFALKVEAAPVPFKRVSKGLLEPRAKDASVTDFVNFMASSLDLQKKTPVFYTGQTAGNSAWNVALIIRDNPGYVGEGGGLLIGDAITAAGVNPEISDWNIEKDFALASKVLAQYARPTSGKAIVVCGKSLPPKSIWHDHEWPALLRNTNVRTVEAYRMNVDLRTFIPLGEFKYNGRQKGYPDPCPPVPH